MLVSFKPQFKKPILDGTKTSTIRRGLRASVGDKLHMYSGRYTNPDYHKIGVAECALVRKIKIKPPSQDNLALCFIDWDNAIEETGEWTVYEIKSTDADKGRWLGDRHDPLLGYLFCEATDDINARWQVNLKAGNGTIQPEYPIWTSDHYRSKQAVLEVLQPMLRTHGYYLTEGIGYKVFYGNDIPDRREYDPYAKQDWQEQTPEEVVRLAIIEGFASPVDFFNFFELKPYDALVGYQYHFDLLERAPDA